MTSPDDHTSPADTHTSTAGGPSLSRLLQTWQAWNGREVFDRAEARARAAGEHKQAARLRDLVAAEREGVAPLDALAAQHEMSSLLAGWEWHTVRAAREQGATWADIARATRSDPEQARAAYLDVIDRQELAATRYGGMAFDDAAEYRAAAGSWHEELHPGTPAHVVEQIEGAVVRDDVDELAALRGAWWNPHHTPAVPVADHAAADHAAADDIAPGEVAAGDEVADAAGTIGADDAGAGRVPHTHMAVRNRGDREVANDQSTWEGGAGRPAAGWLAQARSSDRGAPVVTFDESGYYSDAEIAAIGDALAAGDTERAERLGDRPWLVQGVTVDTAHAQVTEGAAQGEADVRVAWPVMPEWMREQARRSEAELADPAAPPARPDDPAEIAARVAALREQIDARDAEQRPPTVAPLIVETSRDCGSTWQYSATVPDGWREDPGVAAAARATARHRLDDEHGKPGPDREFSNWTQTRVARERAGHDVLHPGHTDPPDSVPPDTVAECDRPVVSVPWCQVVDPEEQEARREQLTRWHTDDATSHDTDADTEDDGAEAAAGEVRDAWGDGPGLR